MTIDLDALERLAKSCEQDNWVLQTGCSWRRIGTTRDGNILCPTNHRIDGHPDLAAASNVLEFIVAAQPRVVLGLIQRLREAEKASGKYHRVMSLLRDTTMKHGMCEPRDRKACTNCNAADELKALVSEYCGPPVTLSADQQRKIATGEDLNL